MEHKTSLKRTKMRGYVSRANMDFKWILNWDIGNIDQLGKTTDLMGCVTKNTKIYLQNRSNANGRWFGQIQIDWFFSVKVSFHCYQIIPVNTGADATFNLVFAQIPLWFYNLQFLLLCNYASTTIPLNVMKCEMHSPYFACTNTQKQIFEWVASLFSFLIEFIHV